MFEMDLGNTSRTKSILINNTATTTTMKTADSAVKNNPGSFFLPFGNLANKLVFILKNWFYDIARTKEFFRASVQLGFNQMVGCIKHHLNGYTVWLSG